MLSAFLELDGAALLLIQSLRQEWLDPLVAGFTALGNVGLVWIILSLLLLCRKSTRKAGALALTAMLLGLLCTNLFLKPLVCRPRPWLDVAGLIPLIAEHDPHSFPSGHTTAAFAAGMTWVWTLPKKWMRVMAVIAAVCMGLSRLYVGVHYPSDVLAGALVGSLCAWMAGMIWNRMKERNQKR